MKNISDLFNSEGLSLFETLSSNDVIGFIVPLYQRRYSWDKTHIQRLLSDVLDGILSIKHDKESLSFVGAAIFVEVGVDAFRTKASSIVDGQQRITTLILICALLHKKLLIQVKNLEANSDDFSKYLIPSLEDRINELFYCFAKSKVSMPKISSDYYPILIREHVDLWHKLPGKSEYLSPVADYLHQYIEFVFNDEDKNFSWNSPREGVDLTFFKTNLAYISEWLKNFSLTTDEEPDHILDSILNTKIGASLLDYSEDKKRELISKYIPVKNSNEVNNSISLLCFSEYLLRRVAITNVRVTEERYGFDIFEALNTTGATLTAIETFRPVVARYEEKALKNNGGYNRSESKVVFDDIDNYLDNQKDNTAKTRESQEIVSRFANIIVGEKILDKLDIQRVCLKKWYEDIPAIDVDTRRKYVEFLGEVADFKKRFWNKKALTNQLTDENQVVKEEIFFYLDFLIDSKTKMVIPILLRFYLEYKQNHNIQTFKEACEKTATFVAIWRAFTCGTGAIDNALISIMSGSTINSKIFTGFKIGKNLNKKIPSIDELDKFYVSLIKKKKIVSKEKWLEIASTQPLYRGSQALSKYLLFLAHHNAEFKNQKLLKGVARSHDSLNYKKVSTYRSPVYSTVEHIAPQNFASDWDNAFEVDANIIDSIGNLTLLPVKENSAVGNKFWDKKILFFEAFASKNEEELKEAIKKASKEGFQFSNSTKKLMKDGDRLTMAEHLTQFNGWNHHIVKERSINILDCAWYELSKSLKI